MARADYKYQITIPFQDIDAAGIVFFAHMFRYAHEAYEHFMSEIGHALASVISEGKYLLPLVHTEADYKQPLRHNETITIELGVKKVGGSSFTLQYRFVDDAGEIRAEVETIHVTLDAATKKKISIPDELRTALSGD